MAKPKVYFLGLDDVIPGLLINFDLIDWQIVPKKENRLPQDGDVYITLGGQWQDFPIMSQIKDLKKWFHLENPYLLKLAMIFLCFFNSLQEPLFSVLFPSKENTLSNIKVGQLPVEIISLPDNTFDNQHQTNKFEPKGRIVLHLRSWKGESSLDLLYTLYRFLLHHGDTQDNSKQFSNDIGPKYYLDYDESKQYYIIENVDKSFRIKYRQVQKIFYPSVEKNHLTLDNLINEKISVIVWWLSESLASLENTLEKLFAQSFYLYRVTVEVVIVTSYPEKPQRPWTSQCQWIQIPYTSYGENKLLLWDEVKTKVDGNYIMFLNAGETLYDRQTCDRLMTFMYYGNNDVILSSFDVAGVNYLPLIRDNPSSRSSWDLENKLESGNTLILANEINLRKISMSCLFMRSHVNLRSNILKDRITIIERPLMTLHGSNLHLNQLERTFLQRAGFNHIWEVPSIEKFKSIYRSHRKGKLWLIIPYRDRESQWSIFLPHMRRYFQDLEIDVRFIVAEQDDREPFRKGILINAAVLWTGTVRGPLQIKNLNPGPLVNLQESGNVNPLCRPIQIRPQSGTFKCNFTEDDYFGQQDVDIIPTRFTNYYHPENNTINKLYNCEVLGGLYTFTREVFEKMNGFSLKFEGWGAEDSDAFFRAIAHKIIINYDCNHPRDFINIYPYYKEYDDTSKPEEIRARVMSPNFRKNVAMAFGQSVYVRSPVADRREEYQNDGLKQMSKLNLSDYCLINKEKTKEDIIWLKIKTETIRELSFHKSSTI